MKYKFENVNVAENRLKKYDTVIFDLLDVLITYKIYKFDISNLHHMKKEDVGSIMIPRKEIVDLYKEISSNVNKVYIRNNINLELDKVEYVLKIIGIDSDYDYQIINDLNDIKGITNTFYIYSRRFYQKDEDILDSYGVKSSEEQFERSKLYKYFQNLMLNTNNKDSLNILLGIIINEKVFNSPFTKLSGQIKDTVLDVIYGSFILSYIHRVISWDYFDAIYEDKEFPYLNKLIDIVANTSRHIPEYTVIESIKNGENNNYNQDINSIIAVKSESELNCYLKKFLNNKKIYIKSLLYLSEDYNSVNNIVSDALFDDSNKVFDKISRDFFNNFVEYLKNNDSDIRGFIEEYCTIENSLGRNIDIDCNLSYQLGVLASNFSTEIGFDAISYTKWFRMTSPNKSEIANQKNEKFRINPKFSIVIPIYRTKEIFLRRLLDSIVNQSYSNFELILVDASEYDSYTNDKEKLPQDVIAEYMANDSRIVYKLLESNDGISENTNRAIEIATGDYIVLSDHDDELTLNALYECAKAINKYPQLLLIYSDEDKINEKSTELSLPHFKPDYNQSFLESNNYMCHLTVIARKLMDAIAVTEDGRISYERKRYDGAQDYDLVLRCSEEISRLESRGLEELKNIPYDGRDDISVYDIIEQKKNSGTYTSAYIYHIPKILYHWRIYSLSTAGSNEAKPYTVKAGRDALLEHLKKMNQPVDYVLDGMSNGVYHAVYNNNNPLVSIIIPNKDHSEDLDLAIKSVIKGNYKNIEIIIVENNSEEKETFNYYKEVEKKYSFVKVLYYKGAFNYSKINNFGVKEAKGEYLLFLNNDTEMIEDNSLSEMVNFAQLERVGIVGAKLLYNDDSIQHAGVTIGVQGIAGHNFREEKNTTYFNRAEVIQDLSAVTAACMMVPRIVFETVGGFNEDLAVAFNDIDFCMKVRSIGKHIVYNPYSVFYHYESKSRGSDETGPKRERFITEIEYFGRKWKNILQQGDPYYNINCTLIKNNFSYKNLSKEVIGQPYYMEELSTILEYDKEK